jgi:hypothetical protein
MVLEYDPKKDYGNQIRMGLLLDGWRDIIKRDAAFYLPRGTKIITWRDGDRAQWRTVRGGEYPVSDSARDIEYSEVA